MLYICIFIECFLVWFYYVKQGDLLLNLTEVSNYFLGHFCAHIAVCMGFCAIVWQCEPWGWWEMFVSVVRVDIVLDAGQQGFWWKAVVMLLKSTAPICPVCLSVWELSWLGLRLWRCWQDDSRGAQGWMSMWREQFPHDLQHIQTHTHTHARIWNFSKVCSNIWW